MTLPALIAVVRSDSVEECRTIVRGLLAAGVPGIEITMTAPGVIELIAEFSDATAAVGAGTVLDARSARECLDAGASFIVSPITDAEVLRVAHALDTPYVGGGLTPTEVVASMRLGCDAVKIFPIGAVGGPRYLRALREPLPNLRAIVSGGVGPRDVPKYLAAGAVSVCIGGALIDRGAGRRGNVEEVAAKAAVVLAEIEEARNSD